MTVEARLSTNPWGKYVVCGACGRSLCRRNRRAPEETWFRWPGTAAPKVVHELKWDADWHERLSPTPHIARAASALDRLARGDAPVRRSEARGERIVSGKGFPEYPPALCPYCDALNTLDPKRLQVTPRMKG